MNTFTFIPCAVLAASLTLASAVTSEAATGYLYAAGAYSAGIFDTTFGFNGADAGISAPRGGLVFESNFWVADDVFYFIKLTVDPSLGIAEPHTPPPDDVNDVLNVAKPGQPVYDAQRNLLYVPSAQTKSGGVWRSSYLPGMASGSFTSPVLLAPTAGLDGPRPSSVAMGPDGQLYVGFLGTGDIRRINNPAGALQTVQTVGKSSKGNRVFGLVFVGNDLYLAEKDGFSVIRNATTCNSGCQAVLLPHTFGGLPHTGIATDGLETVYVATANSVMRYSISAQSQVLFANSGQMLDGTIVPFAIPSGQSTALVLDSSGNLWVGDDTTGGLYQFHGRLWFIPANSAPVP